MLRILFRSRKYGGLQKSALPAILLYAVSEKNNEKAGVMQYDELDAPPRSRPRHVVYVGNGPRFSDPHAMSVEDYGIGCCLRNDETEESEDDSGKHY